MMENVIQWLEKTAEKFPDCTAVKDADGILSFSAYRNMSYAVSRVLISRGLCQQPVAVYLEKSAKVLIAFAGIAAARCFYTPVDTALPKARIEKMLSILQPSAIITEKKYEESAKQFGCPLLFLEDIQPEKEDEVFVRSVLRTASSEDLLYVLFTSGSTGEPKGVSITHRSVINYINWVVKTFSITDADSFANQAPFYFDNSILDIYSTMKTGARLNIVPKNLFSQPVRLFAYLRDERISTIFWVPSALILPARLKAFRSTDLSSTLKRVLFCGEVMPVKQLNIWKKWLPDVLYANLYGPTEITDACTCYIADTPLADDASLPIGKAIDNCEVFLLNGNNPVPQGEEGEICVRGVCLSPGYYRNPAKTAEVFVQNPLRTEPDRIYRTGDIGKVNMSGELMYICRKDFQIKHLGHRIELGEIDTASSSLPGVESCCTIYDDVHKKIILFLEGDAKADTVSEQLTGLLPDYMIPSRIITRSALPHTLNGKIDRMKLLEEIK